MSVLDSPGAGRVLIALDDGPLVAEPTWTRFDDLDTCRCFGYTSFAGRQSELDTTDTGNAQVDFHDRDGTLDDDDLVGCQILLQLYNPVSGLWYPRWRGHIDDIDHDLVPTAAPGSKMANVALTATGIFDYLGGCLMLPGVFGDPGGPADVVFYDDEHVDDRIIALLTDAGLATDMWAVFSGNVNVNETLYDREDSILTAIRDAADAEFPGVANFFEDQFGRAVFHGRFARFDPEGTQSGTDWDFTRWQAATREDVTSGVAQIREFAFNRPRSRVINTYVAYPREDENGVAFDRSLIPDLQREDVTSQGKYGYRGGQDAPDLIIKDNPDSGNTGAQECGLFGDFYMSNYATLRKAIQRISIKSLRPDDARASATYALMCGADISDVIRLTVDEAALSDVPFFIDGVSVECRPLAPDYDMITVMPNLTPASYYDTDVFNP